jgi:hypothetical protein
MTKPGGVEGGVVSVDVDDEEQALVETGSCVG